MRGGFVACLGDHEEKLEAAVERVRWHRGVPERHRHGALEMLTLTDPLDGPRVEHSAGGLVLVHGEGCGPPSTLQLTAGRFAALHWDGEVLVASRDRLGLAPLFYRVTERGVWLATEVHALLHVAPNAPHLHSLSARAAFAPMDEETGWVGVRRVLPGCQLEIDRNLRIRASRYWDPGQLFGTYRGTRRDALVEMRACFRRAVERAYEPGAAVVLSGGQDSAAIAVSLPPRAGKPHLIHAQFAQLPGTDERHYAQVVAGAVGAPLHVVPGEAKPWDIDQDLDLYSIPYSRMPYGIDEATRAWLGGQGIRVALDGHDGDGVLGPAGGIWAELVLKGRVGRLGSLCRLYGMKRALRGIVSEIVPNGPLNRAAVRQRGFLETISAYFSGEMRARIRAENLRWVSPSRSWKTRQVNPLLPRATISFEQKEIEAACHGVDQRHPFADRDFVDFMVALPCETKADPVRAKSLMVEALGDDLPGEIRQRPKSDYVAVLRHRVDPRRCIEVVRASGIELPDVDYRRLFEQADADPGAIPIFLLVNLARVHRFAQRAR